MYTCDGVRTIDNQAKRPELQSGLNADVDMMARRLAEHQLSMLVYQYCVQYIQEPVIVKLVLITSFQY